MSLQKAVSFGGNERFKFTFRADFFNVFNRHQLGGPNTNMALNNPTDLTKPDHFGIVNGYGGLGGRSGQIGARLTF